MNGNRHHGPEGHHHATGPLDYFPPARGENDIIARGLIKDNFFGGYFTVTKKIGKSIKGYYTPFHAKPFGSIAEMEDDKSEILRNIQSVKPHLNDDA